jgi:hypothetical protein
VVAGAEAEVAGVVGRATFLKGRGARGAFYVFVGSLTFATASWSGPALVIVSSVLLMVCGVVLALAGGVYIFYDYIEAKALLAGLRVCACDPRALTRSHPPCLRRPAPRRTASFSTRHSIPRNTNPSLPLARPMALKLAAMTVATTTSMTSTMLVSLYVTASRSLSLSLSPATIVLIGARPTGYDSRSSRKGGCQRGAR